MVKLLFAPRHATRIVARPQLRTPASQGKKYPKKCHSYRIWRPSACLLQFVHCSCRGIEEGGSRILLLLTQLALNESISALLLR